MSSGASSLAARNYQPVLVEAVTSKLSAVPAWPLAMSAMYLSQPLHFGDYGGLPLKIIWALFALVAIAVLGSGLYPWLGRRGTPLALRVRGVSRGGAVETACGPAFHQTSRSRGSGGVVRLPG